MLQKGANMHDRAECEQGFMYLAHHVVGHSKGISSVCYIFTEFKVTDAFLGDARETAGPIKGIANIHRSDQSDGLQVELESDVIAEDVRKIAAIFLHNFEIDLDAIATRARQYTPKVTNEPKHDPITAAMAVSDSSPIFRRDE
jgi:hypothetical protein